MDVQYQDYNVKGCTDWIWCVINADKEDGEVSKLTEVPAAKRKTVKKPQPKLDSQRYNRCCFHVKDNLNAQQYTIFYKNRLRKFKGWTFLMVFVEHLTSNNLSDVVLSSWSSVKSLNILNTELICLEYIELTVFLFSDWSQTEDFRLCARCLIMFVLKAKDTK